jgi:hypothetical protein
MKKIWKALSIIGILAFVVACHPIGKILLYSDNEILFADHVVWFLAGLIVLVLACGIIVIAVAAIIGILDL